MGCTCSRCSPFAGDVEECYGIHEKSSTGEKILLNNTISTDKSASSMKKCRKCRRFSCQTLRKFNVCKSSSKRQTSSSTTTMTTATNNDDNAVKIIVQENNIGKVKKNNLSKKYVGDSSSKNTNQNRMLLSPSNVFTSVIDDDTLTKIIRCFPFPPPKNPNSTTTTPRNTPNGSPRTSVKVTKSFNWRHGFVVHGRSSGGVNNNNNDRISSNSGKFLLDIVDTNHNHQQQFVDDAAISATNCNAMKTLSIMVAKSVEATVPLLVPWESWLRQRLSNWVQLSGHEGTIVPASDHTLWKKRAANDSNESTAYCKLMDDVCCPLVPRFYREVEYKNELFIEIEDLMRHFESPAIMDVKLGTRTFLESEVTNPVKRQDLYIKMVALDPSEPTEEENADKAITKLRYMQFREQESSTASLGFRVDGIKERYGCCLNKDYKKIKTRDQVMDVLCRFLGTNNEKVRSTLIDRLKSMRSKVEQSEFFSSHEVVGSSLLIMYDDTHASAWMIDFAKALPLEPNFRIDHRSQWQLGNHEDGYLFGLDNFIDVLEDTKLREIPLIV